MKAFLFKKIPSTFEANTSELRENLEEMFPRFYTGSDAISRSTFSITHWCVTRREHSNSVFLNTANCPKN